MVRMRDVLRSVRDVTPQQGTGDQAKENKPESEAPADFSFPSSGRPSINRPAPASFDNAERPKQDAPSESPAQQAPVEEKQEEKVDLFRLMTGKIEAFLNDAGTNQPLSTSEIEDVIDEFVATLSKGDQLFMQGLSIRDNVSSLSQHATMTAIVAIKVGMGLGLNNDRLSELALCAAVHEVGMVRVPAEIVSKKSELTYDEFEIVKMHPVYALEILSVFKDEYPFLAEAVSQEHERWNGKGYPNGVREDDIHEYAQVLGIADTFVALTHRRHYRDNFIAYKAIQSIIEKRNVDFSAKMIKALIDVISIFPVQSLVKLNDGSVARVTQTNKQYPVRPIIEVIQDTRGLVVDPPVSVDLSQEPMIYIISPVLAESAYK